MLIRVAIRTNLQRTTKEEDLGLAASMFWKTTAQGAATTLVAAFDPALKGKFNENEIGNALNDV